MPEFLRLLNRLRAMSRSSCFHCLVGLNHTGDPAMVVCATITTANRLPVSLLLLLSTGAAHG
jgi:hypothetical protein